MSYQNIHVGSTNSMINFRAARAMACRQWYYPETYFSATSVWQLSHHYPAADHFDDRIPATLDQILTNPWYYMVELKEGLGGIMKPGYHWRHHGLFSTQADALKAKLIY